MLLSERDTRASASGRLRVVIPMVSREAITAHAADLRERRPIDVERLLRRSAPGHDRDGVARAGGETVASAGLSSARATADARASASRGGTR